MEKSKIIGITTKLRASSFLFLLVLASFECSAQRSFVKDFDFLMHLKRIDAFSEGVYFIDQNIGHHTGLGKQDTLQYFKGIFSYQLKEHQQSIAALKLVGNTNPTYRAHSHFLSAFQEAYLGNHDSAVIGLGADSFSNDFFSEIQAHLFAGISLLRRDYDTYLVHRNSFSKNYYQLSKFQDQLALNYEGLLQSKKKSAFLAGALSAVVPGAGKFYLGKIGEGYTTLLVSTILALGAREAYRRDGPDSFRFGLFTGLFSTVYIANIWGSVLGVKIYRDDINATFDEAILLNMHVPLRTIFD